MHFQQVDIDDCIGRVRPFCVRACPFRALIYCLHGNLLADPNVSEVGRAHAI